MSLDEMIDLQSSSDLDVSEHLNDMRGHIGRDGQVGTSRLETELISSPNDRDDLSFQGSVRVRSLWGGADLIWILSNLLLDSALFNFDAVLSLITISITKEYFKKYKEN